MNAVLDFAKSLKRRFIAVAAVNFILDLSVGAVGLFYLSLVLAGYAPFLDIGIDNYFVVAALWGVFVIARTTAGFRKYNDEKLIRFAESKNPDISDAISVSYSLLKKPPAVLTEVGEAFKENHLRRTAEMLNGLAVRKILPLGVCEKIAFLAVVCAVLVVSYCVSPFRFRAAYDTLIRKPLDISGMEIFPRNDTIDFGGSVKISIAMPSGVPGEPVLLLKSKEGKISPVTLVPSFKGAKTVWSFTYENVFEEFRYHFKVGTARTAEYLISVVKPVIFGAITLTYDYPPYTGLPRKVVKNEPEIECYSGTHVGLSAVASEKFDSAEIVFENSAIKMKVSADGISASARFIVRKEGTYGFVIHKDGRDYVSPRYRINILKDLPPTVEIVSPAQDLVVAGDETIPIIYSCEDDFGLSSLKFVYRPASTEKEIPLETMSGMGEYSLRLESLKPKPGDVIKYYLAATDTGGNSAYSRTYQIEIASYDKKHSQIMDELNKFSDDLVKLLDRQSTAYEKLRIEKIPPWDETKAEQLKILEDARKLAEKFAGTISKMSDDPYFDGYLMNEYAGMQRSLGQLRDNPLSKAVESASRRDMPSTQNYQREAIAMLEKLLLLSRDVLKYQNLSDLESHFGRMEKKFDSLMSEFDGKNLEELLDQLDEISKIMNEIENLIREMPSILPEEFINSPALKDMNFQSARDAVSSIKDALSKSDFASAKKMMEHLKNELKKMRDSLKSAAQGLSVKNAPAEISKKLSALNRKVGEVVKKQQEIYNETSKYDDIRLKRVFAEQEKLLKELAEKQKSLNRKASALKNTFPAVQPSLLLMDKIYAEFAAAKVHHAQKYLEDVITNMTSVRPAVAGRENRKDELLSVDEIIAGEQEILRVLKTPPEVKFSEKERNDLIAISKKQDSLRGELNEVRKDLSKIMNETAAVSYQTAATMAMASEEMASSSERLSALDTPKSLENQKNAIELLLSSSSEMESAASGLGGLSFGQKPSPSIRPSGASGGTGGLYGVKLQRVELPGINDYKVPAEFRSEIMKAMQEKYPQEYEKIIQRYYRKLIE